MYKYSITFTADTLDEGALRDVLEERFRIYDSVVSRSKVGQLPNSTGSAPQRKGLLTPHQERLLSLFEGGALVSPKTLKRAVPGPEIANLPHHLIRMCASGLLRRVGHGLYQSTAFPEPTEADLAMVRNSKRVRVTGNEDERLLSFLSEPREGTDIRFHLRVTRQRVEQKVKLLLDKGLLFRVQVGGTRYLYSTDKRKLEAEMSARQSQPSHGAKRIMEALPAGPCLMADLATFCGLSVTSVRSAASELEERGFVRVIGVGGSKALVMTREGQESEYASPTAPKAPVSNLSLAYGDVRGDVIEVLAIIGEATTKELTMALRGLHPDEDDANMGQRVQRLRGEGLLISIARGDKKHPAHRLSDKGEEVWRYIREFRDSPSRALILEHIRNGVEELHSRLGVNGGVWTPNERALSMMRVIDSKGAATQREIVELMEVPFDHPRSADLSLATLREKGLVQREGIGTGRSPYTWRLTDEGRSAIRSDGVALSLTASTVQ